MSTIICFQIRKTIWLLRLGKHIIIFLTVFNKFLKYNIVVQLLQRHSKMS